MHSNPVKVSFNGFSILFKIISAYCDSFFRSFHGYDIGPGPLPETKSQLDETITKDRQKSTVCHLCKTVFDNLDDLVLHKSLHINPKFCRHKCSVEDCQEGFVLKVLQNKSDLSFSKYLKF